MPDTPGSTQRDFRGIEGVVDDADRFTPPKNTRPVNKGPKQGATTTDQAQRSKRVGTKGEPQYGGPTDPPPHSDAKTRAELVAEQAAEIKRMNQLRNQSTDSSNP